tara:strand:- start:1040 stop:1255 length:216 start_codon:yes stop_codon:yes gene_type:complete
MTKHEIEQKLWRLQERAGDLETKMGRILSKHWDSTANEITGLGAMQYEKAFQSLSLIENEIGELEEQYDAN